MNFTPQLTQDILKEVMSALRAASPSDLRAPGHHTPLDRSISLLCRLKVANALSQDPYKTQAKNAMHISATITLLKDARERLGHAKAAGSGSGSGSEEGSARDLDPQTVMDMALACMDKVEIEGVEDNGDRGIS